MMRIDIDPSDVAAFIFPTALVGVHSRARHYPWFVVVHTTCLLLRCRSNNIMILSHTTLPRLSM
jgi:hypothetical protein